MNNILGLAFVFCFLFCLSCKQKSENQLIEVSNDSASPRFKLSLAQWSFHKALQSGQMDHLDFAAKAASLGFEGIEYVNAFFKDKATDTTYLSLMNEKAKQAGVKQILIMIDGEGNLGELDETKRDEAVRNHYKWVDAAAYLGCHSIRVNAEGNGREEQVSDAAVLGLKKLCLYAKDKNINVIVENHGGYSSHGVWLSSVISRVNMANCGTLPDFGNFCIEKDKNGKCVNLYDMYKGMFELMPYAKGVSAKSYNFGELGFETTIDYTNMMQIIKNSNYSGFIGVEYEGDVHSEEEGVIATRNLLKSLF